ncbi:MAG: hypothetical protein UZ22_OP11002000211 [Microgenomates bacterium OLB23]|nr:MAG: hypothetical protein UZ22_OP11002000211 [Microgenomates bacterium OLB23]
MIRRYKVFQLYTNDGKLGVYYTYECLPLDSSILSQRTRLGESRFKELDASPEVMDEDQLRAFQAKLITI